jgi:hypothetical protein
LRDLGIEGLKDKINKLKGIVRPRCSRRVEFLQFLNPGIPEFLN